MEALQISLHRSDIPWFQAWLKTERPCAWNHKDEICRHFLFYEDSVNLDELKDRIEQAASQAGKEVMAFKTKKKVYVCQKCGEQQRIKGLSYVESCKCGHGVFDTKEV